MSLGNGDVLACLMDRRAVNPRAHNCNGSALAYIMIGMPGDNLSSSEVVDRASCRDVTVQVSLLHTRTTWTARRICHEVRCINSGIQSLQL